MCALQLKTKNNLKIYKNATIKFIKIKKSQSIVLITKKQKNVVFIL